MGREWDIQIYKGERECAKPGSWAVQHAQALNVGCTRKRDGAELEVIIKTGDLSV